MRWASICVIPALLAAALPNNAVGKSGAKLQQSHVALLADPPEMADMMAGYEAQQDLAALKGSGGGLNILKSHEENDVDKSIPRPWKTRFDLQPYDFRDPDFLKPANRLEYRRFYASNPVTALAPNSVDRKAQSTVELIFGLTGLGAVACSMVIVHHMSVLDTDKLSMGEYQFLMVRVIALASLPWLALAAWTLTLFVQGVANPMRDPKMVYHWQCSALAWFLLIASLVNTAYFTVHALWLSRLFFKLDRQAAVPMGRIFSLAHSLNEDTHTPRTRKHHHLQAILNFLTDSCFRQALLFMEVACGLFGFMLITFRWGANSQFCQPEVFWATTALVITVAILIVFTTLAVTCSVLLGAYVTHPWMRDFVGSFHDARLAAEAARREKIEKADEAAEAANLRAQKDEYEEEFDAWNAWEQDVAADYWRHRDIMEEHARYETATQQMPPGRAAAQAADLASRAAATDPIASPVLPRAAMDTTFQQDSVFVPAPSSITLFAARPPASGPTPFGGSTIPYNAFAMSARTPFDTGDLDASGSIRRLSSDRITQAPLGSSNAFSGSQNAFSNSIPEQPWAGDGFSMPFGQRPVSTLDYGRSEGFSMPFGQRPNSTPDYGRSAGFSMPFGQRPSSAPDYVI